MASRFHSKSKEVVQKRKQAVYDLFRDDSKDRARCVPQSNNNNNNNSTIVQSGSDAPKVTIGMESFLKILEQFNQQQKELEQYVGSSVVYKEPFIMKEIKVVGEERFIEKLDELGHTKHTGASITVEFSLQILQNVVSQQVGLSKTSPYRRYNWVSVTLIKQVQNRLSLRKCVIQRSSSTAEDAEDECHIGLINNEIKLLCGKPGVYNITLDIDVSFVDNGTSDPFSTANSTSPKELLIFLPKAVKNSLDFKINFDDVQVKVTPSLSLKKEQIAGEHDNVLTRITCSFPSTTSLSIQWTPKVKAQPSEVILQELEIFGEEKEEPKKVILPVTTTSQQNTLHAIGEGLVKSTGVFDYSIVNGSITQLDISINPYGLPFKVLSVNGRGIKKWNLIDQKEEADEILDDAEQLVNQEQKKLKLLRIQFQYGIEGSYHLKINTEQEMPGTTAKVFVPSMNTLKVTRETGTLAVVARTNVEIKEEGRKYLRRIDNTELPAVQRQTPFPILHSYRFLEKGHELNLAVTRHDDIEVLCTCIESCVYEVTLSSGKLLHKIKMNVKNTAKQYIRLHLFKGSEVWSTTIDGQTVKPSSENMKDGSKTILLPLSKKEESANMSIDMVFTVPAEKMEGSGSLDLELARFDAPVNVLQLHLFLPRNFRYSEFEGDITETEYFSNYVAVQNFGSSGSGSAMDYIGGNVNTMLDRAENIERLEEKSSILQDQAKRFMRHTAGKKPVNLGSMDSSSGQVEFKFERCLLLEHQPIKLKVDFKEIKKGFFQRRSTSGNSKWMIAIISLFVLLFAIYIYRRLWASTPVTNN